MKAAAGAGLVKLEHVSVDGTKLKANASKHRAMSYGHMLAEDKRIREEIERWFEEVERNDRAEDEIYGKESGWRLPPELATAEKRREFIEKFIKELEERRKAEAGGKREQPGPKPRLRGAAIRGPPHPRARPGSRSPVPTRHPRKRPNPKRRGSPRPSPRTRTRSTSPTRTRGS